MRNILIVVDIQNDFVDGSLGTPEAQAIIENAAKKIAEFDGDIFVTHDTHFGDYMTTQEGKNLPVEHCVKGTQGWELNSQICDALVGKDYITVEKVTFGSASLPCMIEEKYGKTDIKIELIGLCTDICVVSNALILKAHFPECEVCVDADCCAGTTPQNHDAALEVMKSCQIKIK